MLYGLVRGVGRNEPRGHRELFDNTGEDQRGDAQKRFLAHRSREYKVQSESNRSNDCKSFRIESINTLRAAISRRQTNERAVAPSGRPVGVISDSQKGRKEGRTEDALASGGEEGRGKPRKRAGIGKHEMIRVCPNGATRREGVPTP